MKGSCLKAQNQVSFASLILGPFLWTLVAPAVAAPLANSTSWQGAVRMEAGKTVAGVAVVLREAETGEMFSQTTSPDGVFEFSDLPAGKYRVSVRWQQRTANLGQLVVVQPNQRLTAWLEISTSLDGLALRQTPLGDTSRSSGGERLSSQEVSRLPLNKRDFSQLLLLTAGTATDVNGAANFTQQFAVNGQRGTTAVFAIDGIDTTDPELGGATFSNFNVDAIQEIRSSSGVLPAEIGHGAAAFTDVITKSGGNEVHGTLFEFHRNAALDARNFFDRRTLAQPGRLPPFIRNEFGFTNGGPVVVPGLYHGRDRTFYFGQYQGFRQVLGTTQVLSAPTPEERLGINSTAFPGDTLLVPVSPLIAPVLARYPLPNDPQGPYGLRTYATSSKVTTFSNQFSIRIDHKISSQAQLFTRFNFNNVDGPLTNPNQTAIDPSFAIRFYDHQRNFGLTYARNSSPRLTWELSGGYLRSTPQFSTINPIQPALNFADGLYESFNSSEGQFLGAFGNLFQGRYNLAYMHGSHNLKMGVEARLHRDTTLSAFSPNGVYTFGGGAVYSPVEIASLSGSNDVHIGDSLPDTLTAFLTATPFSFEAKVAPPIFAQGSRLGSSAVRREAYNFYFQDTWKTTPRLSITYGIRYEVNSRFREAKKLTSNALLDEPATGSGHTGRLPRFLVNPQPPYTMDWKGLGPRLALEWQVAKNTIFRAGGALTTLLPNLYQDNFIVASIPYAFNPFIAASPNSPVRFQNSVLGFEFPPILTPQGDPIYASGRSTDVAANTEVDLARFQRDLAGLTPGGAITPFSLFVMSQDFQNGYIGSYTAGLEQELADIRVSASYTATVGVKLHSLLFPNSYAGADPGFAPFTQYDSAGNLLSGLGPIYMMGSRGHSTFHSLQVGAQKTSLRGGLGFQASYTFSKSLDDASSAWAGFSSAPIAGAQKESFPQNPSNWRAEKGPSNFDVNHAVVFSLAMALPLDRVPFFMPLGRGFTSGWQFMNISTLTSSLPFSVYSGVQQTGFGSASADRPDQVGRPAFSTGRQVREDYFGRGASNTEFFSTPIGLPDGTGPNRGRPGTLGRNTFRGPGFRNFDVALIKDTPIGRRSGTDLATLQFRAEFFNVFNFVNFGLPANILRGTGFGLISRTAGSSRQLQFSLKLIY